MFCTNSESFLLKRKRLLKIGSVPTPTSAPVDSVYEKEVTDDVGKRTFLKVLGGASLGAVALSMLPTDTHALVVGSSPTIGVVGVKNAITTSSTTPVATSTDPIITPISTSTSTTTPSIIIPIETITSTSTPESIINPTDPV